jgi:hypothetical protein
MDRTYFRDLARLHVRNPNDGLSLGDTEVDEGETATNSGTWSDPGVNDNVVVSASVGNVTTDANGTWSWSFGTSDGPDQSQTVTITATDKDGATDSESFPLIVNNVAPVLDTTSPASTFTVPGTATAFDTGLTLSGNTVFVAAAGAWTCAGGVGGFCSFGPDGTGGPTDGTFLLAGTAAFNLSARVGTGPWQAIGAGPTAISGNGSRIFAMNDTHWSDNHGSMTVDVFTALTATPSSIDEGQSTTITGSFIDPGVLDEHTVTISWPDGDEVIALSVGARVFTSAPHLFADDNPTATAIDVHSVNVTVDDNDGGLDDADTTVTVNNVDPTVTATGDTIDENGIATLTVNVTDPGTSDTFTIAINWGEGTPVTTTPIQGDNTYTHQYLDDDPTATSSDTYAIAVTVTDDDLGVGVANTIVTVNNVDPTVTATGDGTIAEYGEPIAVGVTATDVGTQDTHTIAIDWGDDHSEDASVIQVAGTATESESHVYEIPGTYTVTIVVTDDDNGSATVELTVTTLANIDIKPGSDVNPLNLNGNGLVPVAILGTEFFDVTTIDVATVRFGL